MNKLYYFSCQFHFFSFGLPPNFCVSGGRFRNHRTDFDATNYDTRTNIPTAEELIAYGYMIPEGAMNRDAALGFVGLAGSAEAQSQIAPRLNTGVAGLAPANLNTDTSNLRDSVQKGASIVTDASGVTPLFVLAIPDMMWDPTARAISYFLQNPWDVETTTATLEEARQEALAAGAFQIR